jgi:hypothetical protein
MVWVIWSRGIITNQWCVPTIPNHKPPVDYWLIVTGRWLLYVIIYTVIILDYWTTIIFKRWIDVIKLNGQCSCIFHMKLLTIAWKIERSQPRRETFICATSLWTWHRRKRMRQGPTGRVPRALSESTGWQIDTGKYHIFWRRKHAFQ